MFSSSDSVKVDVNLDKPESFELDITWNDISHSQSENILKSAMKRNGVFGYPTNSLIVLEDGTEYIPENLSLHWECYHNSVKVKPKHIKYNIISGELPID